MKILRLLNKKYFSITTIFLFMIVNSFSENQPVDIWNIDKNETQINLENKELKSDPEINLEKSGINVFNMQNNNEGKRKVSISHKKDTNKSLKILSKNEIEKIKKEIKLKKINKKTVKKETQIVKTQNLKSIKKNVNKEKINVVDVCTILEKCSIDEISKYLLEQGKKKNFPDLTTRQ